MYCKNVKVDYEYIAQSKYPSPDYVLIFIALKKNAGWMQISSYTTFVVKFMFSKNATKIDQIFTDDLAFTK